MHFGSLFFQWNRRHGVDFVLSTARYTCHPYKSLEPWHLAGTGNLLSKVDKEKCYSGLIVPTLRLLELLNSLPADLALP